MNPIGFKAHDHGRCVSSALKQAESVCADLGVKFTFMRKHVLEILLREHRAMGAYDILAILGKEGHKAQPPVAYRALDFLVSHGFAHKIERLNAYIACSFPASRHQPMFLICSECGAVGETKTKEINHHLEDAAADFDFEIRQCVLEAEGCCPNCKAETHAH